MSGYSEGMTEANPDAIEGMLLPRVPIDSLTVEKNIEKVNSVIFELYKEAVSVVNLAAHVLDEGATAEGGWPRNQAICAGLMIRIAKFMVVVAQLSAKDDRGEVVNALNRSIMESAINLEFLVRAKDDRFFDQFVVSSLGPERELYDLIQDNVRSRGGEVWPIEYRMLASIDQTCGTAGVKIEDVKRKYGDWGGGMRERLKALRREAQYVSMQRIPSHAVHGTWVDLYKSHLGYDQQTNRFHPENTFSSVDARALAPIAIIVLEATHPYIERFFSEIPESRLVINRIDDLCQRTLGADAAHEKLMNAKEDQ
jgi:hypothetical protein